MAVTPRLVASALPLLVAAQALNATTGAMHAAGFFVPGQGFVSVREDVGRHNALAS
ncbi:MAG: formate dehydrogenase accessory sulfurtransferase FdhD [Rhodoplanes sp.]